MTNEKFHAFSEWLSTTPPSQLIQNVSWIIPTTQTIHIICISILIGAIGMVDLRILGFAMRSQSTSSLSRRLLPYVWGALPILLITGSILAIGEPARSLENLAFQVKMLLLICGIIVTLLFQTAIRKDEAFWELSPARRASAKLLAVLSLAIWIGIIFAGRYIAYMVQEF
jgi:putative copper export protein